MALPSYVINFDELADMLEGQIEEKEVRRYPKDIGRPRSIKKERLIPPIKGRFKLFQYKPEDEIIITSIRINQTGWKAVDNWSLKAGKDYLVENVYTKELVDEKIFDIGYRTKENIDFFYDNNSGNSKEITVEICYLDEVVEVE